jgi:hypothetical protein
MADPIRILPPARPANDVGALAIAGHAFTWVGANGGAPGGMTQLRVALRGATLGDLARALARIEGARITGGPAIASRGGCYLVHCPGFKMVLSMSEPADGVAQALVSRNVAPALVGECELSTALARLIDASHGRAETPSAVERPSWPRGSTLRRAALQPGKTLARKMPLVRRTPLGRGKPVGSQPSDR